MAYPQGMNFRLTVAYVTDGTGQDCEYDSAAGAATYPRTTAQGNNVGWEDDNGSQLQFRNRNTAIPRLAGTSWCSANGTHRYRFDLASTGDKNIRVAMGEYSYSRTVDCELLDTTTSLGVIVSGSTAAANNFKAANNTNYTAANWVSNEATHIQPFTFSTTICRFRMSTASTQTGWTAHLYVEDGSAATTYPMYAYAQQ